MGVYLSVYLAQWPRFLEEIGPQENSSRAWELLQLGPVANWLETDADQLRWHVDGWIAQYRGATVSSGWHLSFEHAWARTRDSYEWFCFSNPECDVFDEFDNTRDAPLRTAALTFLDGVCDGWAFPPDTVEVLADAWALLAPRVGELRPFIEPYLLGDDRVGTFDLFASFLTRWGTVMTLARERGLGVTYWLW
ncbi:hypothetical protein JK358_33845 [Nocardia sp. 2]|uniref:DUF4253 domain-containing protein n=1 Tax=Nocardia acididurans TaxID=2802282 RepID=A0ABS1MGK8_9NOCA|nr:hypothetical protein [Nocardia acididurans]MBL1079401.1 hypothetical protein [Nocardia acididurans]